MVLPGLERSLFIFSIQHERQTWKGCERQLVIKATNLTEKAARMSRVHTSSVISGLGNFFPPGWIPAESSELYAPLMQLQEISLHRSALHLMAIYFSGGS